MDIQNLPQRLEPDQYYYLQAFINYLNNFSDSFKIFIFLWPLVAMVLTLPILLVQYLHDRKFHLGRIVLWYLLTLFLLAVAALTLYPLPVGDPTAYCISAQQAIDSGLQLRPFNTFRMAIEGDKRMFIQIVMNVLMFIPLGILLRMILRVRWYSLIILSLALSVLIEIAQLTGSFGYYPCAYRLFSVDDMIANTVGGVIGFMIARMLMLGSRDSRL